MLPNGKKSCEWLLINSTRNLSIKVDHATLSKLIFPPTLACSKFQPALNSELRQQLKQSELALNDNNVAALWNYGLRPTKNLKACRKTHNLSAASWASFHKLFKHSGKTAKLELIGKWWLFSTITHRYFRSSITSITVYLINLNHSRTFLSKLFLSPHHRGN